MQHTRFEWGGKSGNRAGRAKDALGGLVACLLGCGREATHPAAPPGAVPTAALGAPAGGAGPSPAYLDLSRPFEERARDLVGRLTPQSVTAQGQRVVEPGRFELAVGGQQPGKGNRYASDQQGRSASIVLRAP